VATVQNYKETNSTNNRESQRHFRFKWVGIFVCITKGQIIIPVYKNISFFKHGTKQKLLLLTEPKVPDS